MTTSHQDESRGPSAASSSHPGTSGRSPPPPRGGAVGGAGGGAAVGGGGRPPGGRTSIGSYAGAPFPPPLPSASTAAGGGGRPSLDLNLGRPGRLSYGSAMHGTRLSYGGVGGGGGASGMPPPMTPVDHSALAADRSSAGGSNALSPPSTASTGGARSGSEFFAALSPSTAKFLRGSRGGAAANNIGGGDAGGPASPSGMRSPASRAAGAAVRAAANAARGIVDGGRDRVMGTSDDDDDDGGVDDETGSGGDVGRQRRRPGSAYDRASGTDDEDARLRSFVQSLLGMRLPASSSDAASSIPTMATPDPATASFYATSLLAKTATTRNDGRTSWRPDDAYLVARALSLNGERKRAVWILDRAGLIGFGMGGDAGGGGMAEPSEVVVGANDSNRPARPSNVSNEQGIRNALLLRAESALLAGQCLVQTGEHERAIAVYEEAMRFPPPPPPPEWGAHGYGYQSDGFLQSGNREEAGDEMDDEGRELDARLADQMYVRSWREQSLSHVALIDDGDDERLLQLAENIRPLLFDASPGEDPDATTMQRAVEGIHPVARLCAARGIAYDEVSNPHRALPFLRMALAIDARCVEALDYVVRRRLLAPEEEREWMSTLDLGSGGAGMMGGMGVSWLRDSYLARLRGGAAGVAAPPPAALRDQPGKAAAGEANDDTLGASPVPRAELHSPSMLSLGSPDFLGGAAGGGGRGEAGRGPGPLALEKAAPMSQTVDDAFRSLATRHGLGMSPDVLSRAAARSYSSHDLRSALAHCAALDAVDPYCRSAGYVHVATLVGLGLRRGLFRLAHRLVDADPGDALAWFAVGSYYHACGRHDLAQRHFSRSTRLDPGCAECWIGFGCSFAACDESDQALASFRAAQSKHAGSHVPLLYMGMEYLRTNHLSLAGHFLTSAQGVDPSDVLCCNELGVWSFRRGDVGNAAFWFVKALRLRARAEASALTSADEALGTNGYILLNGGGFEGEEGPSTSAASGGDKASTPRAKHRSRGDVEPPVSAVLCAVQTPSGQSIAASAFGTEDDAANGLTDTECIERCKDQFWEPTIFNLGQSYRKMKRYPEAIVCFEKCSSLNPGNYAAYAALGFAKHLGGDVDGAIDSYHEALSRKPEDPFTSEMLTRALAEAVTYPPSLAMLSSFPTEDGTRSGGIGSSILKKIDVISTNDQQRSILHGDDNYQDSSMFTSSSNDVDMSLA